VDDLLDPTLKRWAESLGVPGLGIGVRGDNNRGVRFPSESSLDWQLESIAVEQLEQ